MRDDLERAKDQLLGQLSAMGERAEAMLARALTALEDHDPVVAAGVIEADRELDTLYGRVQHGVLATIALHGPVGGDLRLLVGLVHASLHLERMGDYAVNAARSVERVHALPAEPELTAALVEIGGMARDVGRVAVRSFVTLDPALAATAVRDDDRVDRGYAAVFRRLVVLARSDEHDPVAWATQMLQLARQLERYADHGVDIAEQVGFVATGTVLELDD